jgi:(S)-2-hydroxyglutarate dehydrogenase
VKKQYVVIGGGIVGSSIAREIRLRDLGEVLVLEKEKELGMHASGRNSGVIHSGINQKPGTLKAEMCVKGSKMLREYCKEHDVPFEECGTLVVARNDEEIETLETLLKMGNGVGVPGLRIIDKDELNYREPEVEAEKALFSPTGAIVDSSALVESIAGDAIKLGAEYRTGCGVRDVVGSRVYTSLGDFEFNHLINCAGVYADDIAHMMGIGEEYMVIPFRGDYVEVDKKIRSMVYQVPDLKYPFLGVHLTKSIDGKTLAGPTATLSWKGKESYEGEINWKEAYNTVGSRNFLNMISSKEFLNLAWQNLKVSLFERVFVKEINGLLKEKISRQDVKPYRSGIRAQIVDREGNMVNDFLISDLGNSTHVLNSISPGMTSCLDFAENVVENYIR